MRKICRHLYMAAALIAMVVFAPLANAAAVTSQAGNLTVPLQKAAQDQAGQVIKVQRRAGRRFRGRRFRGRRFRGRRFRGRRFRGRRFRGRRFRGRRFKGRRFRRGRFYYYPRYYSHYPYYRRGYGRCGKWKRRCASNWGFGNKNYYGCLRYHGC